MSNRMRKKMLKKTSYQKTKEEFESITEKRKKKKEVNCFLLTITHKINKLVYNFSFLWHQITVWLSADRLSCSFCIYFFVKSQEYIKNNKQREEAIQKYKQKKLETFQMLSKKTKKGQPNLNLQMEYLLQKITQGTGKWLPSQSCTGEKTGPSLFLTVVLKKQSFERWPEDIQDCAFHTLFSGALYIVVISNQIVSLLSPQNSTFCGSF